MYYSDHRVIARCSGSIFKTFNTKNMTANVNGVNIPVKFEVCATCRGRGSHVNPSIDSHGLSREDFENDPDFAEAYFRGDYDVPCYECDGLRVSPVPFYDRMNERQREAVREAYELNEPDLDYLSERRRGA
jgi:hypothetical protein